MKTLIISLFCICFSCSMSCQTINLVEKAINSADVLKQFSTSLIKEETIHSYLCDINFFGNVNFYSDGIFCSESRLGDLYPSACYVSDTVQTFFFEFGKINKGDYKEVETKSTFELSNNVESITFKSFITLKDTSACFIKCKSPIIIKDKILYELVLINKEVTNQLFLMLIYNIVTKELEHIWRKQVSHWGYFNPFNGCYEDALLYEKLNFDNLENK